MKQLSKYVNETLKQSQSDHINEWKYSSNSNVRLDNDIDKIIDDECNNLFWNYDVSGNRLKISNLIYTIKFSDYVPIKIDYHYAERCLNDLKMDYKNCNGMYIPQNDYTYIKEIDTEKLEKYNKTAETWEDNPRIDRNAEKYDIYYFITDRYFLFRIITKSTNTIMDFISEL